jgi:hypothetical protein
LFSSDDGERREQVARKWRSGGRLVSKPVRHCS